MTTLHELADKARATLPRTDYKQGGSRIDAALELAEAGTIISLGIMPVTGHDYWSVGDYTVSIGGKSCSCPDQSAPLYKGGKLCKHRLAAMLIHRLNESRIAHLETVLRNAPGDVVTIRANVYYADAGRDFEMTGHHYPGRPWDRYAPDACFRFDETMFTTALRRTGWQVDGRPSKQGMAYHYRLVPADGSEAAYGLNATDHETLERRDTNLRMHEIIERLLDKAAV